jgi:hypothetical protein
VQIATAEDAWFWMVNVMRAPFDELRVTDLTGDECLMHVVDNELKFPTHIECGMPLEDWREFWRRVSVARRAARAIMTIDRHKM